MPSLRVLALAAVLSSSLASFSAAAQTFAAELGWVPKESFASGLRKTVAWYLEHRDWCESITTGAYRRWLERNYANRGEA